MFLFKSNLSNLGVRGIKKFENACTKYFLPHFYVCIRALDMFLIVSAIQYSIHIDFLSNRECINTPI